MSIWNHNRHTPRFTSHALIEIKTGFFKSQSALLIDLSIEGFQIEFVDTISTISPNKKLSMIIPLQPFGIFSDTEVKVDITARWFNANTMRCGGVFDKLTDKETYLLEQIIAHVKSNSPKE